MPFLLLVSVARVKRKLRAPTNVMGISLLHFSQDFINFKAHIFWPSACIIETSTLSDKVGYNDDSTIMPLIFTFLCISTLQPDKFQHGFTQRAAYS